ncbi:hypothetical protein [Evansella halocellulosilytica]|nr:hypothetical protein [Evansella halocellulosilytica]
MAVSEKRDQIWDKECEELIKKVMDIGLTAEEVKSFFAQKLQKNREDKE